MKFTLLIRCVANMKVTLAEPYDASPETSQVYLMWEIEHGLCACTER